MLFRSCIFVKRSIFSITGLLDEKFTFWYCDNDFGLTLKKYGLKHCLISSSVVEHLVNRTLSTCDTKEFQRLTSFQQLYFDLKWKHGSRIKYYWFMFLCKMKFAYRRFKTGLRNCMTYLKQMLVNGVNLACRTVMARRSFYRLNCFLFHLSVKGMGLNNYECSTGAEELFFSRILTKLFDASAQITVFDIGANVGEYSTALKRHLPNALIYAFEPHPKTYIKLKNLGGQKFLTYNIGFSNTMGEGYLYDHLNADGSQHASIHSGVIERIHGTPAIKHTIQIETIDNFICTNGIKHIHFIKIDTEGNDINVLRGALNSIKTGVIDVIQFEFNTMNIVSRTFMKDAFELLGDYQLFRMLPRGLLPLRHYFTDSCELFMFQNIVCVRKNLQSDIV